MYPTILIAYRFILGMMLAGLSPTSSGNIALLVITSFIPIYIGAVRPFK